MLKYGHLNLEFSVTKLTEPYQLSCISSKCNRIIGVISLILFLRTANGNLLLFDNYPLINGRLVLEIETSRLILLFAFLLYCPTHYDVLKYPFVFLDEKNKTKQNKTKKKRIPFYQEHVYFPPITFKLRFYKDINECNRPGLSAENQDFGHICHDDANCTNTEGSYLCACLNGFSGNGLYCDGEESHR